MYNKQITLNIAGTKLRQGGFSDLVIVGVFPGAEFANMDRAAMIAEKPVYLIKHTNDYILYQLLDRRVKSCDSDTNGVLSIAITIPSDMQLADGKSPYTLLKSIYETFRSEYMTSCLDGRDEFLDKTADVEVFSNILAGYSLERRRTKYVVMSAMQTGTLCVPQDKLEAFFRDSQYPEFANYKDIEIGVNCESSASIARLEIPRPICYDVYVNNIPQQVSISKHDEIFSTNLQSHENVSFTLGALLEAENNTIKIGKAVVSLDLLNNRITCRVEKIKIACKVIIEGPAKDAARNAIENGRIKIVESGAGYDIMLYRTKGSDALAFDIPVDVIKNPVFEIQQKDNSDNLSLQIDTASLLDKRVITITIKASKKVVANPLPPTVQPRGGYTASNTSKGHKEKARKQQDSDAAQRDLEIHGKIKAELSKQKEEFEEREKRNVRKGFINGFMIGAISALVLCLCGYFCYSLIFKPAPVQVDRVKIFTQVLEDTIQHDDFYKTDEVKDIVGNYNKLNEKAEKAKKAEEAIKKAEEAAKRAEEAAKRAEAAETFKDTKAAADEASDALTEIEDIAKEFPSRDVNNAKERAEAAVKKANDAVDKANNAKKGGGDKSSKDKPAVSAGGVEEQVKDALVKNLVQPETGKEQPSEIDKIKEQILELVKKKDLNGCQNHPGWNKLGQTDKNTVDYLLRTAQYKKGKAYYDGKVAKMYTDVQVNKIMNYINGLKFEDFKTWADLEAAKKNIVDIRKNSQR